MHFKMSSAICFNLVKSEILSSCNALNNVEEGENGANHISFFSHNVFKKVH